jgi:chromosome partitioning protein
MEFIQIDVQSAADAVRLIKQAQSVRQGPPQAVMFLSRAVKGTKLKTEAMELLGKLTPTIKPCSNQSFTKNKSSPILRAKQLRCGTQGGQPAKDSGKEYSRLFKEIMGALT